MILNVRKTLLLCIIVMAGNLSAQDQFATQSNKMQQSDELILEDNSYDISKLKKYNRPEDVVNSIQRDPFYRMLDGFNYKEKSITDYDLGNFSLVGTVADVKRPLAMFKVSKDRKYIVRIGDRIGSNNGVVVNIDNGEVLIREIFTDINKNRVERSTIKKVDKPV